MLGWLLKTFENERSKSIGDTAQRTCSLMIEYCSLLTLLYRTGEITKLENVQGHLSVDIDSVNICITRTSQNSKTVSITM